MVNGSLIYRALESVSNQHGISFIYRSYYLPMPDPSPSTLTVLNSNFLQLGRRSGGRPQPTVYRRRFTWQLKHTALVGIEPTTFRSWVQRAVVPPRPQNIYLCFMSERDCILRNAPYYLKAVENDSTLWPMGVKYASAFAGPMFFDPVTFIFLLTLCTMFWRSNGCHCCTSINRSIKDFKMA